MKPKLWLGALPLALGLSACNFAPRYQRPATNVASSYQDAHATPANAAWQIAAPNDTAPRGDWWKLFNDPGLNALEARVESANQDIAAAVARYDEARAAVHSARAAELPNVTANAGFTRNQTSKTTANVFPNNPYNNTIIGADFTYELDLWGRVRNSVAQARASAAASAADLATMDLDSHAELAADYFTLRGDDSAIDVLDQTIAADRKALEIVQNRYNGGDATEGDLDQSQAALASAQTLDADEHLQRAAMEHAIAILVGASAAQFTIASMPLAVSTAIPAIDPGVPADLLQRRPDVAAAERRVIAANANIGVARAAYFPTISLGAMLGGQSASVADLFNTPSRIWSLGPAALQPLFDGGAINAANATARAQRDEAIANYRGSVLGALRDVEDNLVAQQQLAEEQTTAAAAAKAEDQALSQAQNLYHAGANTYLDVLIPQTSALQARLALTTIEARRYQTSVQLIKALGGGWKS